MAEEAPASETSVTMPPPAEASAVDETLNSNENGKSGISVDAGTAQGVEESVSNAEASVIDPQKSLELANELMEKGNLAIKENDFGEAADNFSRALEIRFRLFYRRIHSCAEFNLSAKRFAEIIIYDCIVYEGVSLCAGLIENDS